MKKLPSSKNINTPGEYAKSYFRYLNEVLSAIDVKQIDKLVKLLLKLRSQGKTIFVIGNGGSSATATTMANDIGFDIIKKTKTEKAFKVLSLNDNASVLTAISNDVGYEEVFINQLKIHYKTGDALIVISASGNSKNLIKASKFVKSKKGKVVAFLGFDGGKLSRICDIQIHVKTNKGEYGPTEDAHLIINHILAHWFQGTISS